MISIKIDNASDDIFRTSADDFIIVDQFDYEYNVDGFNCTMLPRSSTIYRVLSYGMSPTSKIRKVIYDA